FHTAATTEFYTLSLHDALPISEWIRSKLDNYPPALQAKAKAAGAARSDMFRSAVKMGVKISFGTDAAVFPHGQNAKEFKLMVDLDRKSTRLNSSHDQISYAVFC